MKWDKKKIAIWVLALLICLAAWACTFKIVAYVVGEVYPEAKANVTNDTYFLTLERDTDPILSFDSDFSFTDEPNITVSYDDIVFYTSGKEVLRIESDGKFYVNGEQVATDYEVYEVFRKFIMGACSDEKRD